MEFKTSISKVTENDTLIRGEKLSTLVGTTSFTDVTFLLLSGRKPDEKESRLFSALMTSVIDHGMGTASSMSSRFVASTGNDLNASVAAGVLALGKYHGGAIEPAMLQFECMNAGKGNAEEKATSFVEDALANKKIIFGFGHKVYKDEDPRVKQLLALCEELGYSSEYVSLAQATETALEKAKGKRLVLNVDGFIAAVLLEMKFSADVGNGVFLIARLPSLVANAAEEKEKEKPVRRVDEKDISYSA